MYHISLACCVSLRPCVTALLALASRRMGGPGSEPSEQAAACLQGSFDGMQREDLTSTAKSTPTSIPPPAAWAFPGKTGVLVAIPLLLDRSGHARKNFPGSCSADGLCVITQCGLLCPKSRLVH